MLLPLPERIKNKFKAPVKEQLKCWVDDLRQWQVGDNDLAVSGHEFLSLCTVTATPMPVDSVSAWLQPFFRSHIVRSNDSLCRFTCHENHRPHPQWSPSSSKPSLRLTHGKCQILIGCQQETDRRICNTTVSPKAAWQNTEGPPAAASCCQIYLITIVYYCLQLSTKPINCLHCPWSRFDGESSSPDVLSQSPTSFWGSTWHWLYLTLNATRLLVKGWVQNFWTVQSFVGEISFPSEIPTSCKKFKLNSEPITTTFSVKFWIYWLWNLWSQDSLPAPSHESSWRHPARTYLKALMPEIQSCFKNKSTESEINNMQ